MIKRSLSEADRYLVASLAVGRFNSARQNNRSTKSHKMNHPMVNEIESVAAEVVVARYLGLNFNTAIDTPDDGYDLLSKNGSKIEIKSTTMSNGKLIVKQYKRDEDVDVFILVTGLFPHYNIIGYTTKDQLFAEENKNIQKDGNPTYELRQDQLKPFE